MNTHTANTHREGQELQAYQEICICLRLYFWENTDEKKRSVVGEVGGGGVFVASMVKDGGGRGLRLVAGRTAGNVAHTVLPLHLTAVCDLHFKTCTHTHVRVHTHTHL